MEPAPPLLRVLLIAHAEEPLHVEGIVRWLGSWAVPAGIVAVTDPPRRVLQRLARERRRVGTLRILDVLAFRVFYRLMYARRDAAWKADQLQRLRARYPDLPGDVPTLHTSSPNSADARAFIEAAHPDLILAFSKNLIAERIHAIPRHGTFVLHPGICPEYRNAHGCFWALADGDRQRVGATLLRIDRGVDTGPIFGAYRCDVDEIADSHIVIQHRAVLDNLEAVAATLRAVARGAAPAIDTRGRRSAEWGQPWLTRHLAWKASARRRCRASHRARVPRCN